MINMFSNTKKSMSYRRIIWMIFVILPSYVSSADELHKLCSSRFSCGDQSGLFYPFWITGRENCGHPDFKLECTNGFAELTISSVKFRILEGNYISRGVTRVARADYIDGYCPEKPPLNVRFIKNILPFSPDTEMLTIYYGCPEFPKPVSAHIGGLDCDYDDYDGDGLESYYVTRNLSSPLLSEIGGVLDNFKGMCKRNVSIPASGPSLIKLQNFPTPDNLNKALQDGFELGASQECSRCIDSKGACGYNQTSGGFVCYCVDGPHNNTCGSKTDKDAGLSTSSKAGNNIGRSIDKSLSNGAKAGIGAASGLAAMLLIAGGFFFYLVRRRGKTQDAQYTSKEFLKASKETSTSTTISSTSNSHHMISNVGVQVFSYEELEEATENFSRELGDGGFGIVYYGMLKDGRAVAVKRLYERSSLKRVEQFRNEVEILKSLKHPNLVSLYGCTSRHSKELLLVYEYISNGTLAEHLHGDRSQTRPLCWSVRLNIGIETASALSFLHASGIIHRDVKTTNILLDDNFTVKVADFGLSRLFPMDQTHVSTAPQGTPGYVDPEYFQFYRINEKSDVYSFGVVLAELITSKEAVDVTRQSHDINLAKMAVTKIQNNKLHELVDPSLGFEKDPQVRRRMMSVAELAFRCLQHKREDRPTMEEIVNILRGIKEQTETQDVVDIEGGGGGGGDDVGILRHNVPPPETDTWTSGSEDVEASPL